MDALGVAFGVAQVLGDGKAIKEYRRMLSRTGGGGAAAGDADHTAEMRKRISELVKMGQSKP